MGRSVIARGRFSDPRHIELAEPVREIGGEVELLIRPVAETQGVDVFALIAALTPGSRAKDDTSTARCGRSANPGVIDEPCLPRCVLNYLPDRIRKPVPGHDCSKIRPAPKRSRFPTLTSRLSCLECRVRPLKENDHAVLAKYDAFLSASRLQVVEVTAEVIERATAFRARYGFTTPDAIHLASAVEGGADVFLTGDSSLARCTEVSVELLESS